MMRGVIIQCQHHHSTDQIIEMRSFIPAPPLECAAEPLLIFLLAVRLSRYLDPYSVVRRNLPIFVRRLFWLLGKVWLEDHLR